MEKRALKIAAVITLLMLAGIVIWGVIARKDSSWWAASGQWIGAVGTVATAGAAIWIARRGWELAEATHHENLRLQDELRRERELIQARLVLSQWKSHGTGYGITVDNGSGGAITNVRIEQLPKPATAAPEEVWVDPRRLEQTQSLIHPHSIHHFELLSIMGGGKLPNPVPSDCIATIRFTDADGRRWRRVGEGEPQRVFDDGPGM